MLVVAAVRRMEEATIGGDRDFRCAAVQASAKLHLTGDAFTPTPGGLHFPKLGLHEVRECVGRRLRSSARGKHDVDVHRSHLPIGKHAHRRPVSNSLITPRSPVERMPSPAIAAAAAASMPFRIKRPSTRTELAFPSRRKVHPSMTRLAGPMMIAWSVRSPGTDGVPALARYAGAATTTRCTAPILRATAVESLRTPMRKAT